jgi:hypothetical protein
VPGLRAGGPSRPLAPVVLVVLVVLTTAPLAACGSPPGGVRLEGAPTYSTAPERLNASPGTATARPQGEKASPTPSDASDEQQRAGGFNPEDEPARVVALLRRDPKVSPKVKQGLKPCAGTWPVTVETGRATGPRDDLVVNVSSCADSVGLGTYVYRRSSSGALVNVFSAERPPVQSAIENGRLVVRRDVYLGNEPICCPEGQNVVVYEWRKGVFHEVDRKLVDTEEAEDGGSRAPGTDDGTD